MDALTRRIALAFARLPPFRNATHAQLLAPLLWHTAHAHFIAMLLLLYGMAFVSVASAAELERSVKAAFVYKFLSFVEWPDEAFAQADAPLVIGVYNADDIAAELNPMVQGRSIGNHPIVVRKLKEDEPLTGLQVLFIGHTDNARVSHLAHAAQQQSILTISENERGLDLGAIINLVVIEGRVRFEIALDTAEKSRLHLSSRLLSLAFNVRSTSP